MKALFLDRDGVINIDYGYVHRTTDFLFIPGIFELCQYFMRSGFQIIVATNQSGIERGYFTENQFLQLTEWMKQRFEDNGVQILDVFYCPYLDSYDRKPNPGMFLKAIQKYNINAVKSVSVGDSLRDIEAASKAGIVNNFLVEKFNENDIFKNIIDKCFAFKIIE